jgi:hypothetical protein
VVVGGGDVVVVGAGGVVVAAGGTVCGGSVGCGSTTPSVVGVSGTVDDVVAVVAGAVDVSLTTVSPSASGDAVNRACGDTSARAARMVAEKMLAG